MTLAVVELTHGLAHTQGGFNMNHRMKGELACHQISWLSIAFAILLGIFILTNVGCATITGVSEALRTQVFVDSELGTGSGVAIGGKFFLTANHLIGDTTKVAIRTRWLNVRRVANDGDVALLVADSTLSGLKVRFGKTPALGDEIFFIQIRGVRRGDRVHWDSVLDNAIVGAIPGDTLRFKEPIFGGASGAGIWSAKGELLAIIVLTEYVANNPFSKQNTTGRAILVRSLTNIRRYLADEKRQMP